MEDYKDYLRVEAFVLRNHIMDLEDRLRIETDKIRSRFMANQLAAMYGYEGALLARMAYDGVEANIDKPREAKSLSEAFHDADRYANDRLVVNSAAWAAELFKAFGQILGEAGKE